jgi:hypothetical protein
MTISAAYRVTLMERSIQCAEKHAAHLAKIEAAAPFLDRLAARLAAVKAARQAYLDACEKCEIDLDTNIAEIGRQVKRVAGLWGEG